MNISNSVCYVLGVSAAAAVLAGCSNSGSPSSFAPSGTAQQSVTEAGPDAHAQGGLTQYYLINLGVIGGKYSSARGINNRGWITGASTIRGSKSSHAALWRASRLTDLGTLGGPNSYFNFPVKNTRGEVAGVSQVAQTDPYLEDFCQESFFNPTYLCQGFSWQDGVMAALPTLGGNNSFATGVNNRAQIVGGAETSAKDHSCKKPQRFDYYAVIWQPNGTTLTLPPYPGDTVSFANAVNDSGDVVGTSGRCGDLDDALTAQHALLWQSGSTIDLGNLGGTANNVPFAINNRGQIVGYAHIAGNATSHAFLWQNGVMSDLGTLPGDVFSIANGINDKGQIVGESCPESGSCRGFIWQSGSMTDLNLLVPPKSKLYVFYASDINDSGRIVGIATNTTNPVFTQRAVVLIPGNKSDVIPGSSARPVTLPEGLRIHLQQLQGIARPIASL
jgi:probable HAF family extracellular repeat protein